MRQLFFRKREKEDFLEDLSMVLQKYVEILRIYKSSLSYITDDIISEVVYTNDKINQCVKEYLKGKHPVAYNLIEDLLDKIIGENYYIVSKNQHFYRCRTEDTKELSSLEEMFHVPFNRRYKVSTQRYSAPGHPCLYLGSSIYNCWQEIGYGHSNLFISLFDVVYDFSVIDLRFPEFQEVENLTTNNFVTFLKKFPLILSTSRRIPQQEKEGHFHFEYVISQLITEYIITSNNKKYETSEFGLFDFILGVYYTSTHIENNYEASLSLFSNLALPAIDIETRTPYCRQLASCFSITDPLCWKYDSINNELNELSSKDIEHIYIELLQIEAKFIGRRKNQLPHLIFDNKTKKIDENIGYTTFRSNEMNIVDAIMNNPNRISNN